MKYCTFLLMPYDWNFYFSLGYFRQTLSAQICVLFHKYTHTSSFQVDGEMMKDQERKEVNNPKHTPKIKHTSPQLKQSASYWLRGRQAPPTTDTYDCDGVRVSNPLPGIRFWRDREIIILSSFICFYIVKHVSVLLTLQKNAHVLISLFL